MLPQEWYVKVRKILEVVKTNPMLDWYVFIIRKDRLTVIGRTVFQYPEPANDKVFTPRIV